MTFQLLYESVTFVASVFVIAWTATTVLAIAMLFRAFQSLDESQNTDAGMDNHRNDCNGTDAGMDADHYTFGRRSW